jgi:hypothetical protein
MQSHLQSLERDATDHCAGCGSSPLVPLVVDKESGREAEAICRSLGLEELAPNFWQGLETL